MGKGRNFYQVKLLDSVNEKNQSVDLRIENFIWTRLEIIWNSSWANSNPESYCCESAALNTPANLENSAVATGLEKVSFHSNP